jgi:16S rRNA (guanine966-N2)-methyltransferase
MRIVSGKFRGRRIIAPKGDSTRPTTDRTRESLFNILASRDDVEIVGARVLDLFAGSGALGLEAMSRGASFCLFVETDAAARGAIRDNIEALELYGVTKLHRRSAANMGVISAGVGPAYTLAFLDPPYRKGLISPALAGLAEGGWLARGAFVVAEQAADEEEIVADGFQLVGVRTYGETRLSFLAFAG